MICKYFILFSTLPFHFVDGHTLKHSVSWASMRNKKWNEAKAKPHLRCFLGYYIYICNHNSFLLSKPPITIKTSNAIDSITHLSNIYFITWYVPSTRETAINKWSLDFWLNRADEP